MADDIDNETVLLLLGKTGAGKSSTGNNILGREEFDVGDSAISKTLEVGVQWTQRHGRTVMVVDGIGLGDTRMNRGEPAKILTKDLFGVFTMCPRGFHSILLVLRYGVRFTEEDQELVDALKSIFGYDFVRNFCIIIVTGGDGFDLFNRENPRKTIQDWCQQQKGPLQTLFQECNNRVVLFHNLEREKQDANFHELFKMLDQLKRGRQRYTHELFQQAATSREQYIVRQDAPRIREGIQRELDQLNEDLDRVKNHNGEDAGFKRLLDRIMVRAGRLLDKIHTEDKGTGVLKDQIEHLLYGIMREVTEIRETKDMMQAVKEKQKKIQ